MKSQLNQKEEGYRFRRLFEATQIKKRTLRNRLVFSPCVTYCATPDGFVTKGNVSYYQARAEHVGLTIVECALVRQKGGGIQNQIGIYDDKFISGLKKLARAIKQKGSIALIQIGDFGARAGTFDGNWDPVSPSEISPPLGPIESRVLDTVEIRELVMLFFKAAQRAYEAGFDGV